MLIFAVGGKDGPEPNGHAGEVSHQDDGGGGRYFDTSVSP